MSRISKEKKTHLILVGLGTLIVVAGLWFNLISHQQESLQKLDAQRKSIQEKLSQIQETIRKSKETEAELIGVSNRLTAMEDDMAAGDLYSSMVNTLRKFKLSYKIEIPQLTSGGVAVDVNLLPKFPYKQVSMSISGTASYYDLGTFVADFENRFPYSRMVNLDLTPASASRPEDKFKLAFRTDIVSLVKPGGPRPANTP
jgi:Tfp pilus assembly protein PilO